jgi:indole-3-acetate monooxygenase
VQHPSFFILPELSATIRSLSAGSERQGVLHPALLDIIYRERWFHLFVPHSFGGLQLSLPQALRIEEGLAWADGSVGWTVTLCSGAGWFIGILEPTAAGVIFSDPKACLAGSGQASGVAEITGDGYKVWGQWKFATGAPHATVFTANCVLYKDGTPLIGPDGQPIVRAFWFWRKEVQIQENWYGMGLVATSSYSFEVQGVTLPANRLFEIDPAQATLPDVIFQYPFLSFAETTLAVNSSGMATRFMDLCRPIGKLDSATKKLEQERATFYKTVDDSWEELLQKGGLSIETISDIGRASRRLASLSLRLVDELYPLCGLEAADTRTEINRVWRNLHTASQHVLLRDPG